jgi:cytochrome b involved in lipid metabolism
MVAPGAAKGSGARVITSDELALHNKEDDLWIAVAGTVYGLTK